MAEMDKNTGRLIGNYRVLAEIGAGGFGKVYQGEHIFLTERTVAIKFLHNHLSSAEEREQFLQEARFLEKLKHPNMLHVFDVGIEDGFPYLVTEYAPNRSLRDRIKHYAPNPLPTEEVVKILSQVGQALYYAHERQIIHRDLKPENILFDAQNEALLSDFGIATTLSTASVKAVGLIGTPLYMAPEQFQGIISKESDQYALGCITYELVTGQTPFTAPDFFSLGFKHLSATPVPPRQYNPSLPVHVEQAILKALAKQRNERHVDIRAFIHALRTPAHFQIQTPTLPTTPLPPPLQSNASYVAENPTIARTTGSPGTTQHSRTQLSHDSDKDNTLTASYMNTQHAHYQGPVTPLPQVIQTPSVEQGPITPFPSTNDSGPFSGDEYPTMISAPGGHEDRQQPANGYASSDNHAAAASGYIPALPVNAKSRAIFRSKRALVLFAALCILLITSGIGVTVFALSSHSSSPGTTRSSGSTATTATGQTTANPTQKSTLIGLNNSTATATHRPTSTPTSGPIATSTTIIKPSPGATSTPTPISTADPKPKPDPTPVSESLTVPFLSSGVSTANSYSGMVTVSVSGTGQAGSTKHSDAFYYYADASGNPMTPVHPSCWVLNINGQSTDNFVSLPSYNPGHSYTFHITVPTGQITFDVCDNYRSDNTGQYYITVTQN